jgi:hypothetical protein
MQWLTRSARQEPLTVRTGGGASWVSDLAAASTPPRDSHGIRTPRTSRKTATTRDFAAARR